MADGGYRAAAQAAVQEERSLRSLIENFTTGRVERVSSREAWFDLLLENSIVVAVFSTKWCSPCQLLKPIVAHLSQIPSMRKLKFVTVDCDELPQVAQEAMVASFPTVKVYSDCREQESVVGGDVQKLVRVLETAAGPGYSR
ncbi:thioredoxin-like protein [Pavlovales sp. CCMP2436]|nr:thioredoxin-like protein [Pavlovales sp. CCMP2436]